MTVIRGNVRVSLPRKRGVGGSIGYEKALRRFQDSVVDLLIKNIDESIVKCIVIAGPGLMKKQIYERVVEQHPNLKRKVLTAHASSAYRFAVNEVLQDDQIMKMIKDTKAAREIRYLKEFHKLMAISPDKVAYGPFQVQSAAELGAIDVLLVTDSHIRSSEQKERQR